MKETALVGGLHSLEAHERKRGMSNETDEFLPARRSLLNRLKDWDDQESWQEIVGPLPLPWPAGSERRPRLEPIGSHQVETQPWFYSSGRST